VAEVYGWSWLAAAVLAPATKRRLPGEPTSSLPDDQYYRPTRSAVSTAGVVFEEGTLASLQEKKEQRLRFMHRLYEATDGSTFHDVDSTNIGKELGWPDQVTEKVVEYLVDKGLAKYFSAGDLINITHAGVVEVETALDNPDQGTEHFAPVSVTQIFYRDVIGSAIQAGSPGATQTTTIGDLNLDRVRQFVERYEEAEPSLGLEAEEAAEAQADIATIRAQLDSPRPKPEIIRGSLRSVRTILEGATGSLAASGLLELLQHVHL
jgi:hypothetical protein